VSLLHVILLAAVQGITEFLPISSSAHLALAPWLLGWPDQGLAFDIALHVGTLAAVLIYFYRDLLQVVAQGFGLHAGDDDQLTANPRLLWLLAAATVPVGIAGLVVKPFAETVFRSPYVSGTMLILVSFVMLAADRLGRQSKDIAKMGLADALWIGFAQAGALIPGTSRSGITLAAGLFRGLNRVAAARFSFLLSTPAIAAAAAKNALDLQRQGGIPAGMHIPFAVGIVVSALTGCLVIAMLMRFLQTHTLWVFVYYRLVFGIIVIALAIFRA
jgi:undecaprenyl-diphosphatase